MKDLKLSDQNIIFWNELCGSSMAKALGIKDSGLLSLKKFDDWYFDFYPYLYNYINFDELNGKEVLEIGLGYGSVAQKLVEHGAIYTGLDISAGPVEMVKHRLNQNSLQGNVIQASVLKSGLKNDCFDSIIAIGCLHHTGDLRAAINQCHRMLKPGGELIFMVYYSYSYRRWFNLPAATLGYFFREMCGYRGVVKYSTEEHRAHYDTDSSGKGAPHTDWISIKSLKRYCRNFTTFEADLENIDQEEPFNNRTRASLLKTKLPKYFGLDVYARCVK